MLTNVLTSLASTERDTLGLDASTLQSLHVDVLDACERALTASLQQHGTLAEAPRAPAAVGARGGATGRRGAPLTPAAVDAARGSVEALLRTSTEDLPAARAGDVEGVLLARLLPALYGQRQRGRR
jgi:hypothetical protein